jgi:hypothetical protein
VQHVFHAGDSTLLHVVLGAVLRYGSEFIFTVQEPRFLFDVISVLQVHESSIHSLAVDYGVTFIPRMMS